MPGDMVSPAAWPGWRRRVRLIVPDLLAFDARQFAWRFGLRTAIGLMLPMALADWLHRPALFWIGIGAFLIALGDSLDDGDDGQTVRLAIGTAFGAAALATGILVGGDPVLSVAGMAFWCFVTGMMGVYGSSLAAMAFPMAWAYLELGLPSPDRAPSQAAWLAFLFVLGGIVNIVLARLLRLGGVYEPLRSRVGACYEALARYFATLLENDVLLAGPVTPETTMRRTLIEAGRVATLTRARQAGGSELHQRLVMLIEIADRAFSLAAMHRELSAAEGDARVTLALPLNAATLVAATMGRRPDPAASRATAAALEAASQGDTGNFAAKQIDRQIALALARALRLALGEERPTPVVMAASGRSSLMRPLVAALSWQSLVLRHSLRFAVVAAIAIAVDRLFPPPFGYWVPLTVTAVLKPYAGMTMGRTLQRIIGTLAGIALGMLLMTLGPDRAGAMAFVAIAFFGAVAVLPTNYSLGVLFLSAGIIPLEHLLHPGLHEDIGLMRIAATVIGAALAVIGGHLLWPDFERNSLPTLLATNLRSCAAYADRVLAGAQGAGDAVAITAARRQAGLDLGNLQAGVQHALSEIGGDPGRLQAMIRVAVLMQRVLNTLNAITNVAPALAATHPGLAATRAQLAGLLGALASGPLPTPADIDMLRPDRVAADDLRGFFDREIDRLAAQLGVLATVLRESLPRVA